MDSLKRFGINDKTTNLIVIKIIDLQGVSKENELNEINKVEDIIKEIISGDRIEFNDHAIQTNLDKKIVKKVCRNTILRLQLLLTNIDIHLELQIRSQIFR